MRPTGTRLTPNKFPADYIKGTWTKVASLTTLPTNYCYAPLAFRLRRAARWYG